MISHLNTIKCAVATGLATLLSACVYESEAPMPSSCAEELEVNVTLVIEDSPRVSRGTIDGGTTADDITWGDEYPAVVGDSFDSRIDLRTFRMALYKVNGNRLTHFATLDTEDMRGFEYTTGIGGQRTYQIKAALRTEKSIEEVREGTYRIMIWANSPQSITKDDLGSITRLDNLTFNNMGMADKANTLTYCPGTGDNEPGTTNITLDVFNRIPMWGCATVSLAGINSGECYDIKAQGYADGSINLLRSMAKATVSIDPEVTRAGFKIRAVTLTHANSEGYIMPKGWENIKDTRELRFDTTAREKTGGAMWNVTAIKATDTDKGFALYMPEYINETNTICLNVDYTLMGETKTQAIYFCRYDADGKPLVPANLRTEADIEAHKGNLFDIVRNHCYEYIVGIEETTDDGLRFKVTIADMEKGGEWTYEY